MRKRIKLPIVILLCITVLLFVGYSFYTHPLSMQQLIGRELSYINTVTAVKINTGTVKVKRSGSPVSTSGTIKGKKLKELKKILCKNSYRRKFRLLRKMNSNHYMISLYMYHDNKLVDMFNITDKGGLYHSKDKNGPFVYLYSKDCDLLVDELTHFIDENVKEK